MIAHLFCAITLFFILAHRRLVFESMLSQSYIYIPFKYKIIMNTYKSMTYRQIAICAGVSSRTLRNWLKPHKQKLKALGLTPNAKVLPPVVVQYICQTFCIDIE